jgi:cytochrome b subunit of formate dehydrogenase
VGTLVLIDGDVVDSSNRNRQLPALHSTIGCSKVEVRFMLVGFNWVGLVVCSGLHMYAPQGVTSQLKHMKNGHLHMEEI